MKILVNDGMEESGIEALRQHGFEVITQKIAQEDLFNELQQFDGIIVRSATKVRKELIDACPQLKFIARGGVGMDNIDVEYARSKNIVVINTPASSSRSVAELAMVHLLACTRGLASSIRSVHDASSFQATKKTLSECREIKGKNLLLLGFGRIGSELAKMALGSEMNILVFDPFIEQASVEINIGSHKIVVKPEMIEFGEGLARADYISLHAPFSGQAILNEQAFEKMKSGVIIINTSRGENIDEAALINNLNSGKVRAAGLDVFQNEPNINPEIIQHPNVCISPHIGASTQEAQAKIAEELVEKIASVFSK